MTAEHTASTIANMRDVELEKAREFIRTGTQHHDFAVRAFCWAAHADIAREVDRRRTPETGTAA